MKKLYKSTKVIFNAHLNQYEVYYKNFLFWHLDRSYKFDTSENGYKVHFQEQKRAEERAIERAEAMLNTVEVWKKTKFLVD